MPSSYTTNLRLELQATGENRTTWGTLANQVFSDVDAAIAGTVSVAMGDANYTLTANNGAPDEARYFCVNATGANTAVRDIIVPSVSKCYLIKNSTTGGFGVNVRTSAGGTQAVINSGETAFVYCDGTTCARAGLIPTSSQTDTTANRVLKVADFGIGGGIDSGQIDYDTVYFGVAANASTANYPLNNPTGVTTSRWSAFTFGHVNASVQAAFRTDSTFSMYVRPRSVGSWGSWQQVPFLASANTWTANQTIQGNGPTLSFNDTDTSNLVHMVRSLSDHMTIDADVNNIQASSSIRFRVDGSEAMRLSAFGDLAVNRLLYINGITSGRVQFSYDDTTKVLALADDSVGDTVIVQAARYTSNLSITGSGSNVQGVSLALGSSDLNVFSSDGSTAVSINRMTSNGICTSFRMDAVQVGNISVTGSNTAYNTSSDERLKTFTGLYDPDVAIGLIRADPVRTYTWNVNGEAGIGWGAQTSYAINPAFATPGSGNPGEEDFNPWSLDYGRRVPFLWAALTKALDKIDDLEARIVALENS